MRPLAAADARQLHDLWIGAGVGRFLWDGEVIPFDRTVTIIETSRRMFAAQGFGLWGVRHQGHAELIGFGGFWHFREPPDLELLYGVAEKWWGRGFATDIGRSVVEYGFSVLRMPTIYASTDAANVASVRVLQKMGFRRTRRASVGGLDTVFYQRSSPRPTRSI